MPQSLSQILLHVVFSTKNREPFLTDAFRDELHAIIGGIVREHGGTSLVAGSVREHIQDSSNNWFRRENEDLRMDGKALEVSSIE